MMGRMTFASLPVGATFAWPEGSGVYRKWDDTEARPTRYPAWRICFDPAALVNPTEATIEAMGRDETRRIAGAEGAMG